MKKRLNRFNMIEIVIAMGIAAFGIMAVVAMIPPALNANRDISADAFAEEAVSKMQFLIKQSCNNQTGWNSFVGSASSGLPVGYENAIGSRDFSTLKTGANFSSDPELKKWNIFKVTGQDHIYYLTSSDESVAVHATLWKEQLNDWYNSGMTIPSTLPIDYPWGVRFFLEISWPVNMNYKNRQTRLVTFDVYKGNW